MSKRRDDAQRTLAMSLAISSQLFLIGTTITGVGGVGEQGVGGGVITLLQSSARQL